MPLAQYTILDCVFLLGIELPAENTSSFLLFKAVFPADIGWESE